MAYGYYMTQRPPMPGSMPMNGLVDIQEYQTKVWNDMIRHDAYARIEYNRELTEHEVKDYELIPEVYNARLTRDSIMWLMELLEDTDFETDAESRTASRIYHYLDNLIS